MRRAKILPFPVVALALSLAAAAPPAARGGDEAVVFTNGDRLTGTIAAKGTVRVRFKTEYGLLVIPRDRIERLIYADGREEVITPPPPPATPPPPVVKLTIVVAGDTFWQAWNPDAAPADPSLRLSMSLGGIEVVAWVDAILDPDDLPGAVVNSFVFAPERLLVRPAAGVEATPPVRQGSSVLLGVELPPETAGRGRLDFAYQRNEGTSAEPEWVSVVESAVEVELAVDHETPVRLEQQRGQMDYHRGAMRRVETFHVAVIPNPAP